MKRRQFLSVAAATIVMTDARAATEAPRIGLLWVSEDGSPKYVGALREGLRALGRVDGKDIRIEDRFLVKRTQDLPRSAKEMVRSGVDVVVVFGSGALRFALAATTSIPIVFNTGEDPVKQGQVKSLSNPGTNATGISSLSQDLGGKRLEILKAAIPNLHHVGVLSSGNQGEVMQQNKGPAAALGLDVTFIEVADPREIETSIALARRSGAKALVVTSVALFAHRGKVVEAIDKARLPAIFGNVDYVEAGGLMALGPNQAANFRRAAAYIDRILRGERPADLAVEQTNTLEFLVNLKTARSLGIALPSDLLVRADRVID